MDSSYPHVYRQILKSQLIEPAVLESVYRELRDRIAGLEEAQGEPLGMVVAGAEETAADETDFELGDPENAPLTSNLNDYAEKSEEIQIVQQTPLQEELERILPAELELRGLLNHWQVTQILQSRTRFHLGRYRIVDSLGAGGYGHVFLARTDLDLSNRDARQSEEKRFTDVAIKVLPRKAAVPRAITKFRREVNTNSDLTHPNLVRFVESAEDGNVHYAVYEYMDGGDARQMDSRRIQTDFAVAARVVYETAKGLLYLHQKGWIHRDIKPGNILLSRRGEVKLGDLGLAIPIDRPPEESEISGAETDTRRKIEGTSDYLSPDQILRPTEPSTLWDIYSLGCTFYFLITGIVPFPSGNTTQKIHAHLKSDAPDPQMFNVQLPGEVSKLIREMMDKSPENRPSSADQIIRRLKPWIAKQEDISEFLRRLSTVETIQRQPQTIQEVSLDEILDEGQGAVFSPVAERSVLPPDDRSPARISAAADDSPKGQNGEYNGQDVFLERLNTGLVWFVLFPLSLIGLALLGWFWLRS